MKTRCAWPEDEAMISGRGRGKKKLQKRPLSGPFLPGLHGLISSPLMKQRENASPFMCYTTTTKFKAIVPTAKAGLEIEPRGD